MANPGLFLTMQRQILSTYNLAMNRKKRGRLPWESKPVPQDEGMVGADESTVLRRHPV